MALAVHAPIGDPRRFVLRLGDVLGPRRWALTLLDAVLERLRVEMTSAGKAGLFDALRGFLSDGAGAMSYLEAAEHFRRGLEAQLHRRRCQSAQL